VKLGPRDKRALAILSIAVVVVAIYMVASSGSTPPPVVGASDSIATAERRLEHVRQIAATIDGKQQLLKQVSGELARREKGIIQAETAPQAQAQLLDIVRRVGKEERPPIEFGGVEMQQPVALGDYGEVRIAVPFTCHVEELVNFLSELTHQPEAVATSELRIAAQDAKQKTVSVRLTVSAVVPRKLVPEKKGLAAF
jgi:hypothetical protein